MGRVSASPAMSLRQKRAEERVEALATGGGGAQAGLVEFKEPAGNEGLKTPCLELLLEILAELGAERRAEYPLLETQAHHHELLETLLMRERQTLLGRMTALFDGNEPAPGIADLARGKLLAPERQPAMRPRPDPKIIAITPVGKIMTAGTAGAGMVRDLVSDKTRLAQEALGGLVKRPREILVGKDEFASGMERGKARAGLDGELIDREMIAGQGQRLFELRLPLRERLARPRINEIEGKTREKPLRERECRERIAHIMAPPEEAERLLLERLHPERETIDPGRAKCLEPLPLERGRVGFERHFEIGRHRPMAPHPGDERRHRFRRHQGRRAAAEEKRGHHPIRGLRRQVI